MEIRGKNILITGANRGIGRAIARLLAEDETHIHLAIRMHDTELVEELKKHGAKSVTTWLSDLSSRDGVEKLLTDLKEQDIDVLINNAGQMTGGLIEDQSLDEIYSLFQVNVLALIQLTQGLIPHMLKRGSGKIVNNASVVGYMPVPCASVYAASKAAVIMFTECIATELDGTGVSALTLITPGIKTRMFADIEKKYGAHIESVPRGAMQPSEYAKMVREAILLDLRKLEPKGLSGLGVKAARYAPALFNWQVKRVFHREKRN